jgi:hypothetical protein
VLLELETPALVQDGLPTAQMVLALVLALSMFAIVLELVRRQKLREEYAILWMGTAALLMLFALYVEIPSWIAKLVGAESVSSVLFFGAHVFLMLVALQFSVRLTKLTFRNKTLSQRMALLEHQLAQLAARDAGGVPGGVSGGGSGGVSGGVPGGARAAEAPGRQPHAADDADADADAAVPGGPDGEPVVTIPATPPAATPDLGKPAARRSVS